MDQPSRTHPLTGGGRKPEVEIELVELFVGPRDAAPHPFASPLFRSRAGAVVHLKSIASNRTRGAHP